MARNFRPVERDQEFLLPVSMRDWLPADDLAFVVLDAVEALDLSAITARYRDDGRGGMAYHPAIMTALLVYAYAEGERSSRRIERLCRLHVAYRVLCAGQTPDHATIARFRADHAVALADLFGQVLRMCAAAGLGRLGVVALDGTKVAADASSGADRSLGAIDAAIAAMLAEADLVDAAEDAAEGGGTPPGPSLIDPGSRLARFREARRQLAEAAEARELEVREALERRDRRAADGDPLALRGRLPRADAVRRRGWSQRNTTDPDARRMRGGNARHWLTGYNAQVVVDEDGLVLAAAVSQDANDAGLLHPMLVSAAANARAAGIPGHIGAALADQGYWSEANAAAETDEGPLLLVPPHGTRPRKQGSRRHPTPGRDRMRERLADPAMAALHRRRAGMVEPVFGETSEILRVRRFMRRGQAACDAEFRFVCLVRNMRKLWRHRTRARRPDATGPGGAPRPTKGQGRRGTAQGALIRAIRGRHGAGRDTRWAVG